jgi:hypothetical protein
MIAVEHATRRKRRDANANRKPFIQRGWNHRAQSKAALGELSNLVCTLQLEGSIRLAGLGIFRSGSPRRASGTIPPPGSNLRFALATHRNVFIPKSVMLERFLEERIRPVLQMMPFL